MNRAKDIQDFMDRSKGIRVITPCISTHYKKSNFQEEPSDIFIYTGLEMTDSKLAYSRYYKCKSVQKYKLEEKMPGKISTLYNVVRGLEIEYINELVNLITDYWKEKNPDANIVLKNLKELPFQSNNMMTKRETDLIIRLFASKAILDKSLSK